MVYGKQIVSWEPEGRYCSSKMFRWEPEGQYCCTKSMAIAPFWFSTEHLWSAIAPFWLSADEMEKANTGHQDYTCNEILNIVRAENKSYKLNICSSWNASSKHVCQWKPWNFVEATTLTKLPQIALDFVLVITIFLSQVGSHMKRQFFENDLTPNEAVTCCITTSARTTKAARNTYRKNLEWRKKIHL